MTAQPLSPSLAELPLVPYLTPEGDLPTALQRQIGIYAIFDTEQCLRYIGYSRDVYQSLKQYLVRQPQACAWYKLQTVERPSRTALEALKQAWLAESGGFSLEPEVAACWESAIDAKLTMTEAERVAYAAIAEGEQAKFLKKIARRLEAQILETLEAKGVKMEFRFNPKLKEEGLLDLK